MPLDSIDSLLGPSPKSAAPKPTPKAAPSKASIASLLSREASGLARTGSDIVSGAEGLWDSFTGAIKKAPERRAAATSYLKSEQNLNRAQRGGTGKGFVDAGADIGRRFERNHMMRDSGRSLYSDVTKPVDFSKGFIRGAGERVGKTALDAVGAAFSPIAAGITTVGGPEIQAVTGVQEQTAGNLLSGPAVGKLGSLIKGAIGGRAAEIGAGADRAVKPGETPRADMSGRRGASDMRTSKGTPSKVPSLAPKPGDNRLFERTGVVGGLQRTFSPETVSERARETATIHRMSQGVRRGEAAAENYALQRHQRVVGNATSEQQMELANYVDTRSTAKPLSDPRMQPAADAMRDVANRYRSRIENVLNDETGGGPSFVTDYYARMWKNPPQEVSERVGAVVGGKQGSSRNLKQRTLPTYQDGIDAGLTPLFTNPLDAMNAYTDNMASFLATHDVQNEMKSQGLTKWAFENSVPSGYTKIEGIRTTKPAMLVDGKMIPQRVLVAPPDVARVYNRTVSKGLDQGSFGPVYRGARAASNAMSQLKLGLSTFHATVMGNESVVSEVAKSFKQLSQGDVGGAAGTLVKAPFAPVRTAIRGGELRRQILDPEGSPSKLSPFVKGLDPKLAKMYVRAGGRVNMDRFYNTSNVSGGFFRGIKNGTFTREVGDAMRRMGKEPIKGSFEMIGKVLDTASAPIFKEYIPRLKTGAWASQMEAFLKDNLMATAVEQQRFAENLTNNIDNRFGELIVDNQFWDKAHFQVAQLLMLSPSWNFGTVREIGGGLAEVPKSLKGLLKGQGVTTKTSYVAALATTYTLMNGMATYMHTGQVPEGQDWLAYRTGGKDENGADERGMIPGYGKDVLAFAYNFPHNIIPELENKANPALTTATQLVRNKDYFEKPISDPNASTVEQMGQAAKYTAGQALPISLSQKDKGPDSKFTTAESAMGVRRAPSYLENPERKAAMDAKYGGRAWRAKLKSDAKQANRDAAPAAAPMESIDDLLGASSEPLASINDLLGPSKPAMKDGATAGGDIRPQFKPIVDLITSMPEFGRVNAENDLFHSARDVHGDGRAMDFSIKGKGAAAPAFVRKLRQQLLDKGFDAYVRDEYNNPSKGANGGHIHVQLNR